MASVAPGGTYPHESGRRARHIGSRPLPSRAPLAPGRRWRNHERRRPGTISGGAPLSGSVVPRRPAARHPTGCRSAAPKRRSPGVSCRSPGDGTRCCACSPGRFCGRPGTKASLPARAITECERGAAAGAGLPPTLYRPLHGARRRPASDRGTRQFPTAPANSVAQGTSV